MRKKSNNVPSTKNGKGFLNTNPIEDCKEICEIVNKENPTNKDRKALEMFCDNKISFWNNYLVSDFAEAALDILGWKDYSGDRYEVRQLISSRLAF